jgi:hypothetical protein
MNVLKFDYKSHRLLIEIETSTRVSQYFLYQLCFEFDIEIINTERGDAIILSDYKKLIRSDNLKQAYINSLRYLIRQNEFDKIDIMRKLLQQSIDIEYHFSLKLLGELEKIHTDLISKFNIIEEESAEVASYLLFTKAISMINSIIDNTRNGNLSSNIFFRPFNESIFLACYFLLSRIDEKGEEDLVKWFRENYTPKTSEINLKVKEFSQKHAGEYVASFLESMLYQLSDSTSKSIHNSYSDSLKHLIFNENDRTIVIENIEFLKSSNKREILNYFRYIRSLLLSLYQNYMICYDIELKILSVEAKNIIGRNIKLLSI